MIRPVPLRSLSTPCSLTLTCGRRFASSRAESPITRSRSAKWARRGVIMGVVFTGLYVYDRQFNASAITRSMKTAYIGVLCTLDSDKIEALHERVAGRLKWVIDTNQGLYLKLGQALGLQAALLPKPYREAFGHVFDRAPAVSYDEVFQKDLSLNPLDIFATFSENPLASASIAQVHKATLRPGPDGESRVVAVKVQKPAIEKQMEWDLFSYRSLMWACEKVFDMPMYFVAKYVSSQMRLETSFINEANNARKCAELLAQTPELRDDVYVPRVYGEAEGCKESDRIMVMEWVDGCRLNDKEQIEKWNLKPREVMDLAISTMSAMTFSWGFIHCDPHPGNILVRPHPTKKGKPQIIEGIAKKWGIAVDANMFASAILLRPFQVNKNKKNGKNVVPEKSQYEQQVEIKERMKKMLENEQLIPRELIFLTRCQRMMQANNQLLGSPSSRVNLTARWASIGYTRSLTGSRSLNSVGLSRWIKDRFDAFLFRFTLGVVDIAFWFTLQKQRFLPKEKGGWEEKLQKQFEAMAKEEFGIEIDDTVFLG
ncbi:uncharacterized protein IL334_005817 [Kwoniella shivajii]|uniref:ABC1 atypical kinase-like domain-containing protein n=1 Tax=Kwoniella shivajii TaxID=564305 RepID=A0ABZ1D4S3_9TREE|nr:hypothetical protein IL334_005817 [Kwoniella shivajii]